MDSQFTHIASEKKIQVYRNDFFSGFLRLTRKLFML